MQPLMHGMRVQMASVLAGNTMRLATSKMGVTTLQSLMALRSFDNT